MSSSPASDYSKELAVALKTVHNCSVLTQSVLRSLKSQNQTQVSAETKPDDTPVTAADLAGQALIISTLHARFPDDAFLGEESADALRSNQTLAGEVWKLVLRAKDASLTEKSALQQSSDTDAGALVFPASIEEMLDLIDLGGKGQVIGRGNSWSLDPIDGTATFMQGLQYAVALCLFVDGVEQLGVIACPNLQFDVHSPLGKTPLREDSVDIAGCGVVLSAVKGQGTYVRSMSTEGLGEPQRVDLTRLPTKQLTELNFVESTIGKTSLSQEEHKAVAESLGCPWPGTVLWSSHMKYVSLILGASDVMVRIPKSKDRYTAVWDHCGSHLCYTEAGGKIRDFDGRDIDFTRGRMIRGENNFGMIATMPSHFDRVDRAVKDVLGRRR